MRVIAGLLACLFISAPALAEPLVWKTEAQLPQSQELPGCTPETDDNCGDTVSYIDRSAFGVNQYRTYFEGVRVQLGFGSKPNSATMMTTDMLHDGAYDWGGVEQGGVFIPKVVIKRFYVYDGATGAVDPNKTALLAFRLKADGTSCLMPFAETVVENAKARMTAEHLLAGPECPN